MKKTGASIYEMILKMKLASMKTEVLGIVKVVKTLEIMVIGVGGLEWADRVLIKFPNGKKRYVTTTYGFILPFFNITL